MNFFKSILSDDPDPPHPQKTQESEPNSPPPSSSQDSDEESGVVAKSPNANSNPNSSPVAGTSSTTSSVGGWSFGGLIKTLASQSESVLETYRRDLQEFGSGLRKESQLFREVAGRAVRDLPASIEVGASVAHGSLESVTHAIDGVIKSTADIISHGKDTVISSSDVESETPDASRVSGSGRYSWFDAQLNVIQGDVNTFSEEPEDLEDYEEWKSGFSLDEKGEEVEDLIGENGVLEGVYRKMVPNVVDIETFWCRYFYRVHKLKQQERVRARLVKRAISIDDEEELSWDVDDDVETQLDKNTKSKGHELEKKVLGEQNASAIVEQKSTGDETQLDKNAKSKGHELEEKALGEQNSSSVVEEKSIGDGKLKVSPAAVSRNVEDKSAGDNVDDKANVVELREVSLPDDKTQVEESSPQVKKEEKLVKDDDKGDLDGKVDQSETTKHSDVSVVSRQQSVHSKEVVEEEEDMGWDEIEDIGSGDERTAYSNNQGGSPNRADVRKRLSVAEVDEDLSWDIEEDD
ncbi:BSD domain-containing protein 1 [Coffea eugenioides]|uniref:BSD domain-containing protein n=1 Tax=Coffea arabica TaxID=13443 RepID=A0A6P6V5Z9_COFAR|nr:BSD domain-containing protein 1-like [Coffea arabica]XP_027185718.1 BSD domain-containing protein 1 [Coffea eugenioides]